MVQALLAPAVERNVAHAVQHGKGVVAFENEGLTGGQAAGDDHLKTVALVNLRFVLFVHAVFRKMPRAALSARYAAR